MGIRSCLVVVALFLGAGVPVVAHHSFAAFDQSREVTVKGRVAEFQWTNPHAWLVVKGRIANGPDEEWSFEMISPSVLRRNGWTKNSLKFGDEVTVTANPARNGTRFGLMLSVLDAEGHPVGGEVPK
jgi:hypothetical protein